jgi:hypothetical protein
LSHILVRNLQVLSLLARKCHTIHFLDYASLSNVVNRVLTFSSLGSRSLNWWIKPLYTRFLTNKSIIMIELTFSTTPYHVVGHHLLRIH